jgi:E3 ubiquitin-protein ligase RNF115/126
MFDPQNMRSGDAVYSQEALDRVISQLMDQNPRGNAPGPATDAAINSLPKTKLDVDMLDENTGQAECSICMSNVDIGEEITTLPCKHWYHFECIKAWLVEHDTCPVCRSGIMPKDGPDNIPRASTQQPLYSQDPASYLSRQQSGSREHPFVVDESPTRSRRAPQSQQGAAEGQSSGSSIAGMLASAARGFFGGDGANSQTGRGNNNGTGGHA